MYEIDIITNKNKHLGYRAYEIKEYKNKYIFKLFLGCAFIKKDAIKDIKIKEVEF